MATSSAQLRKTNSVTKSSAKSKVKAYLEEHPGWVPGYELTTREVGGSEGLKRLRELRDEGLPIIKKKMKNSNAYAYRLVQDA